MPLSADILKTKLGAVAMQPDRLGRAQTRSELRPALGKAPIMNLHEVDCALDVSSLSQCYIVGKENAREDG